MLTRRIFFRSKHIHVRVMTSSILKEEAVLASVISLFHVPYVFDIPSMSRYNS